ncbi:protein S100-A16-like isoform X1 [Eublepharis macularius]|uniref:Protein S100 n=2 Tax=Eublepharis macularius TaxID=481883 RepID=A0AA97L814_EUBMA|nr:protein S100-A16-like isoform X1 [Eublepharis macularius]
MHGAKGGEVMTSDPSELEWAIQTLVKNYDKYSSRGGCCCCCKKQRGISKGGFRKMLTHELNHMLTDTKNKQAANKLICDLDENHDGQISFDEYWILIGGIASPISCLIRQQEENVKFTK